ncbi:MAG: hypothetical protein FWE67_02595 [Planctomycetaceae bacterium]|nr:hypothetical protein [Planctomycetaceae bacterium]
MNLITKTASVFCAIVCAFICTFILSAAFSAAQEPPTKAKELQPTAEVLALLEQSRTLAATLDDKTIENKVEKVSILFQILSLELRLPEKDAAKKTIVQIKEMLPSIDREDVQNQIRGTLVFALLEMDDYQGAAALAAEKVIGRGEMYFVIAERIIENNKNTDNKLDCIPLLQQVLAGAVEKKDTRQEAVAEAVVGGEYARQGKTKEAKESFQRARSKAKELEEIEEREITALILRLQIENNLISEAYALIESLPADKKSIFYGLAAVILAKEGKPEESGKILDLLEAGDAKDNAMLGIAKETIEKITVEMLTQFINSVSKPERKMYFLNALVPLLAQKGRFEEVKNLSSLADKPDEVISAANLARIDTLMKEKKFDEADKAAAEIADAQLQQAVQRHIILERIKNGDADNGAALAEKILTDDERKACAELRGQLPKVAEIEEPSERTMMYREILETQLGLFDVNGAKATIALMLKNIASVKEPVERIVHQLALAGVQSELNDKQGAADNLRSLLQFLSEIKDISVLKELVPEENPQPENPAGNQLVLDLKKPVSEEDIREKIIEVYLSAADVQARIGAIDEAKKTLSAAKQQIDLLKDTAKRIPLFLLMTQMTSEFAIN